MGGRDRRRARAGGAGMPGGASVHPDPGTSPWMSPRRAFLLVLAVAVLLVVAGGAWLATRDGDDGRGPSATPPSGAARVPEARIGDWRHRADPDDVGLDAGWAARPPAMTPVSVPGAAEPRVVDGEAGRRTFAGSVGWWSATLAVTRPGRHAVRFGSVGHDATVWIGGERACTHTGAYEPFDCVVDLDRAGRHRVMLRADWRDLERQAQEGHDRAWWNWGGPSWDVEARRLADVEADLVGVETTLSQDGRARVALRVELRDTRPRATAQAARPRRVRATLTHGEGEIAATSRPVPLAPGASRRTRVELEVAAPQLWSPGDPRLHELELRTDGGGRTRERVGLRELRREGTQLRLNGAPLRLVGAGLPPDARGHGDALTARDRRRIIEHLGDIGANAVRSQHPLSDAFLADLDEAGILVWQLVGPFDKAGKFWAQTPQRRREARRRALATADRQAAHPSMVAWSLSNEVSGRGHPRGQAEWVADVAQSLRRRTPGILVAVDIWGRNLPRDANLLYRHLDAVGMTEYIGMAELAGAPVAEQEDRVRDRLERLRAVLPDKVLVITEYGANANGSNPVDAVGGYGYQADLLRRRTALYAARRDVAGMLVWILRDYAVSPDFGGGNLRGRIPGIRLSGPLSEKGLFRYDGTPKPAVRAVREAFADVD